MLKMPVKNVFINPKTNVIPAAIIITGAISKNLLAKELTFIFRPSKSYHYF